ncbi:MAG: hypothetical protein E6Y30_05730 [Finegoldia magna]|nr:hypothetical protein [Finegoldia magna]
MKYENFVLKCEDIEIKALEMKYLGDFHEYAIQEEEDYLRDGDNTNPSNDLRKFSKIL